MECLKGSGRAWATEKLQRVGGAREAVLRVTLLGTGNPRPLLERFGPSILVEMDQERLLFDVGRGATQRMFEKGVSLAVVSEVFLTHLHSDHVVGLPDLWLTGWIFQRTRALHVRGPPGTREMVGHLSRAYAFDVHARRDLDEHLPAEGAEIQGEDLVPGVVHRGDSMIVTAFEVDHGPVKPAFGYRIEGGGRSVVLSGDTRPSENLMRHAQGTDLLIHEVAAATEEHIRGSPIALQVLAHHTSPEAAGEVFTRVAPRLAVYSHIVLLGGLTEEDLLTRTRRTYAGPLAVGQDGMVLSVGDTVTVELPSR